MSLKGRKGPDRGGAGGHTEGSGLYLEQDFQQGGLGTRSVLHTRREGTLFPCGGLGREEESTRGFQLHPQDPFLTLPLVA